MREYLFETEFDANYIERPINSDDFKKNLESQMEKLNIILEKDKFATGEEITNLKISIGALNFYLNQLDKAVGYLESAHEESRQDKLVTELFLSKMYLAFLYFRENKAYKCDEYLLKCAQVALKKSDFKKYLPKIHLYQSLNKRAQKEKSKQHLFAQNSINSCIDCGNLELMEVAKRLLAEG